MESHVLAITGGKGGVGKSATTINLGVSLRLDGYSVALIDADVEMPNLVEMLDLEPGYTIHDVLSGTAETADACLEVGDGFGIIPGDSSLTGYASIESGRLESVVSALAASYEYILLDTGAGLSYDDVMPLALADEIILVSSPDPAAVENAKRTQAFVRKLNRPIRGVVITKADSSVDGSVVEPFDAELLGVIPDDQAVQLSTAAGKPLEIYAPNSPAAQAYRQLEANLTDGVLPPQRTDQSTPAPEPDDASDADATADDASDDVADEAGEEEEEQEKEEPDDAPRPGMLSRLIGRIT